MSAEEQNKSDAKQRHNLALTIFYRAAAFLWGLIYWSMVSLYYAVCFNALCLPALIVIEGPDLTGFLFELGQKIEWQPKYPIWCSYVCATVNFGFPVWHYLIKRNKTDVFDNKLFFSWVFITALGLIFWMGAVIVNPIH